MTKQADIEIPRLNGKQFERIIIARMQMEQRRGEAICGRYGVQVSMVENKWIPIESLPDFEGLLANGQWFTFDAKVCSAASFPLHDDKFKRRQLSHFLDRSDFGAICFLLLHFNARELKARTDEAETWAFPVSRNHPFWREFDAGEVKSISRLSCQEYGVRVEWEMSSRERNAKPDVVSAIHSLASNTF